MQITTPSTFGTELFTYDVSVLGAMGSLNVSRRVIIAHILQFQDAVICPQIIGRLEGSTNTTFGKEFKQNLRAFLRDHFHSNIAVLIHGAS